MWAPLAAAPSGPAPSQRGIQRVVAREPGPPPGRGGAWRRCLEPCANPFGPRVASSSRAPQGPARAPGLPARRPAQTHRVLPLPGGGTQGGVDEAGTGSGGDGEPPPRTRLLLLSAAKSSLQQLCRPVPAPGGRAVASARPRRLRWPRLAHAGRVQAATRPLRESTWVWTGVLGGTVAAAFPARESGKDRAAFRPARAPAPAPGPTVLLAQVLRGRVSSEAVRTMHVGRRIKINI